MNLDSETFSKIATYLYFILFLLLIWYTIESYIKAKKNNFYRKNQPVNQHSGFSFDILSISILPLTIGNIPLSLLLTQITINAIYALLYNNQHPGLEVLTFAFFLFFLYFAGLTYISIKLRSATISANNKTSKIVIGICIFSLLSFQIILILFITHLIHL